MDRQRNQMRRSPTTQPEVELAVPRLQVPTLPPNAEGIGRSRDVPQNDIPEIARPRRLRLEAQEAVQPTRRSTAGHRVRNILTSRSALRQAIVLNEILGQPRALRTREDV